jgi:RNA polymerase sigma-70 factor (ECF subfamily)
MNEPDVQPEPPFGAAEVSMMLIEHRAGLIGYLLVCVRNHADAEDLFQEVSLAVTKSAGDLRNGEGFMPWAREIARRRVLAHYRKSKRLTPMDPDLVTRMAETAAELDRTRYIPERVEALHSCLEELPLESRRLINLRYENYQRPVETIAEQFGRSVQATYAILKRSRLILRECVTRKLNASV